MEKDKNAESDGNHGDERGEAVEEEKTDKPAVDMSLPQEENKEVIMETRVPLEAKDSEEEEEWLDILGSGQLKKKVLRKGNSLRPERSFVCVVSYEGTLQDGTVVDKEDCTNIQIGDGEVIQGLDLALPLMHIEEIALLEVRPRFGYGSLGREPDIGPDETLLYKVELHSAEPEPEVESFSVEERKKIGNAKRERGNWWYARQQPALAIQCYRRALDYLDDVEGGITIKADQEDDNQAISAELRDLLDDRLKVYNNLAAAQMQIKAFDTALQSVDYVLRCQPDNVKALFRKGKIFATKGDFAKSVDVLRFASQLEPDNKIIKQELIKVQSLKKGDSISEKNLYKKMFGHGKKTETETDANNQRQKTSFPWALVLASTTAIVMGVVAYRYKF